MADPIRVEIEGFPPMEFEAGTPQSIIDAVVKRTVNKGEPPGVAADVAKSAAFAVPKAVAGVLGTPGDVVGLFNRGIEHLLAKKHGGKPEDYRQPGLQDYVGSDTFRKPLEAVTGKFYEPETRAGKVTDTAIQTATTMGRGLLKNPWEALKVITGVTAGTEGAGALTNDNPWARLVGGLFGGGIPAAKSAIKSREGAVVKDAIGEVSEAEIKEAVRRMREGERQGVPLMGTEALDKGHQLASSVLSSPRGNKIVEPFVRDRARQTDAAVRRDIVGPTGSTESAQEAAQRAQLAATKTIDRAEGVRSDATRPFYQAARNETVPQQNIDDAKAKILAQLDNYPEALFPDQRAAIQDYLGKLGVPEASTASFLDRLYRDARNAVDVPQIGATDKQKNVAAAMGPVSEALKDASNVGSIQRGRELHQAATRQAIEPLTSGPVGAVAGKNGYVPGDQAPVPRTVGAISNENITSPKEIRTLYQNLNQTDPKAFPGIAKTYFEQALNKATEDLRSGANPTAGAKFRELVAGNAAQRENFNEIMRGVAMANGKNPDDVIRGANSLLDTLERTGRTPGIGSQTQPRGVTERELGKSKAADLLEGASTQPLAPFAARLRDWIMGGRYERLAQVLTSPDSVEQLVRLAKIKPNTTSQQFYAAQILGLDRAISASQDSP